MVCGRVIGNELRGVPPECLPIWGQRWSGYRAPHGPSPFSTRIFSADQMSEVGLALTSPTQFEVALMEEDEEEGTSSESSQFRNSFLSSPLPRREDVAELTFWSETPKSTHSSVMMLPWRQSEQLGSQLHALESVVHPPNYAVSVQDDYRSPKNDCTSWDMCCSIRPQVGHHSHLDQGSDGHPQHIMALHSVPESQFVSVPAQSQAYQFQLGPSSQPGSDCFLPPYHVDDQTRLGPTIRASPSYSYATPLHQQSTLIGLTPHHEPGMHDNTQPRYPVMSPWPLERTLPNPSFSGSLLNQGVPYRLVSDHHGTCGRPGDFFGLPAHVEGYTTLFGNGQFTG